MSNRIKAALAAFLLTLTMAGALARAQTTNSYQSYAHGREQTDPSIAAGR
jgi:hypothetical protein